MYKTAAYGDELLNKRVECSIDALNTRNPVSAVGLILACRPGKGHAAAPFPGPVHTRHRHAG
jgi:hypothetical protein